MGHERVALHLAEDVVRVQRWRRGHPTESSYVTVTVGTIGGRWFTACTGRLPHRQGPERGDAWLCTDEAEARQLAAEWMTGDGWHETPAVYDAHHQPIGAGWRKIGGTWVREQPTSP